MSQILLMKDNYLDPSVISNVYESSEQAAFPADNLYNAQRRSKVWRSAGAWEIDSTNSYILFRETTGVDLDCTLTEGEYASSTALFAHIKSKMESAVGAGSTYTIEHDTTTNKVRFTSNGAGGGGIFEMYWTTSTGLASTLGFLTTEDDTGVLTYLADELKLSTGEWLKWDMGISTNPQAFVMIAKRNSPIPITVTATIKLQGNETDSWGSPSYEQALTYNSQAMYRFSDTGLHTEALRYWKLLIEDLDNPEGHVELGSVFLGNYFESTRGAVQFPFNGKYIDRSVTAFSEGGQTFSDEREKSESFSINWFGLTIAEKEDIEDFWTRFGTARPFFVAFDPDTAFSSSVNKYIRYCKFEQEPAYQLESPGNFSSSMALREEL